MGPQFLQLILLSVVYAAPLLNVTQPQQLRYITLEEHCVSESSAAALESNYILQLLINGTFGPSLLRELLNVNTYRLDSMNANNVRKQIVNNDLFDMNNATAGLISNNAIYEDFTKSRPDRFGAFCSLAMGQPEAAAQELQRCIKELGFVGGLANSNLANGTFYDSSVFWPVFATAEQLDVPIYLHPSFPPTKELTQSGDLFTPAIDPDGTTTFDEFVAANLATTTWGFEAGAGLSFLRLYAAGLFDTYPNLKIILGHMGEMMPYMLERSAYFLNPLTSPKRSLEEVWAENVWITTSGYFWLQQIPLVLRTTAVDRIMFSVDTPFNRNYQGKAFMEELQSSGLVTQDEFEGIAFRNAETLLRLT